MFSIKKTDVSRFLLVTAISWAIFVVFHVVRHIDAVASATDFFKVAVFAMVPACILASADLFVTKSKRSDDSSAGN